MQIQLTGFLGAEQGMLFMKDLWALLLSAQVHSYMLYPASYLENGVFYYRSQANCKLTQSEGSKVCHPTFHRCFALF